MANDLAQVTEDSARGGFFLFSGAALASIILAVSAILMGRFLGPELYGQYNLVLVIPSLLVLLTDLGMNAGVTKFVASLRAEGKEERIPIIIRQSLFFRMGIGVIISVLSLVFASYFALIINRPDFTFYIQLASFSVIFQVVFTTANSAFVGLDRSEYSALNSTARAVLTTILQVALVFFSFSVTGALIGFVGGFVIGAVVGGAILVFKFLRPQKTARSSVNENRNVLVLLARYGMPVYVSVVLVGFFPLYQQLVLAFLSSDAAIGNFRAAFNFVTLLTVLSTSITTALLPAFSKLESATPEMLSVFFNKANKYTSLIVIPITVFAIIFSAPIVALLYGSTYTSASLFLSLSCSVFLLSILGSLTLMSVFNGLGKTRLTMNMTLINFVLLLILTPLLGLAYDVVGVIAASLVATTVASVYAAVVAVRKLRLRFSFNSALRIYLISVLAALPPLGLLLFTKLSFVLVLAIGGLLYLGIFVTLMPLFKIVNDVELESLTRVTGGLPLLKSIAKILFTYQRKILFTISRTET
jgi:O-antigen/teichoic acid export membrane protein